MSDPYGRTLHSDLGKMPSLQVDNKLQPIRRQDDSQKGYFSNQWSAIFGKSGKEIEKHTVTIKKETSVEKDKSVEYCSNNNAQTPQIPVPRPRNRKFNPKNPFNSFVVTLKVPNGWKPEPKKQQTTLNSGISKEISDTEELKAADTLDKGKKQANSFFSRRNYYFKPASKLRPLNIKHASWKLEHVRPEISWPYFSVKRRTTTDLSSQGFYELKLPHIIMIPPEIRKPKRRLMSSSQLQSLTERMGPNDHNGLNLLTNHVGNKNAFDSGQFEQQMWSEKYAPRDRLDHLKSKQVDQIITWLCARLEKCNKRKSAKRKTAMALPKSSLAGFVVDDDFDETDDEGDLLVVNGVTGSGKTSAVYAACATLGVYVLEVNSAVKRTGKELGSMLDGIAQNHAVHNNKVVVILVDDVDVVYEHEAGSFWPTLIRFVATSRRPVILTCTDLSLINLPVYRFETVCLGNPDFVDVTRLAKNIALCEGHLVDIQRLANLVVQLGGDIRRVLAILQFWCQFGIGGSPSGSEWVPKQAELETADRIISEGTWFMLPDENLTSLDEVQTEIGTRSDDDLWTNGALSLQQWNEPIVLPPRTNSNHVRQTFYLETWNYGTSLSDLVLDIAPYKRLMVAHDVQRNLQMSAALANQSLREARMTRRMWLSSGIDSRQYLGMDMEEMNKVLGTGFASTAPQAATIQND